jgi:hypothetical protein
MIKKKCLLVKDDNTTDFLAEKNKLFLSNRKNWLYDYYCGNMKKIITNKRKQCHFSVIISSTENNF